MRLIKLKIFFFKKVSTQEIILPADNKNDGTFFLNVIWGQSYTKCNYYI